MVRFSWIAYIFGTLSQQYTSGLEGGEREKGEWRKFLAGAAGQTAFHFLKWEDLGSNKFEGRVRSQKGSNLTHNRSNCS